MPDAYLEPVSLPERKDQLTFLSVLNFILRNIKSMLVLGIIFGAIVMVSALMAPPTYTSTAIVSAGENDSPGRLLGLSLPGSSGKSPQYYVDLMTSPAVLEPLVERKYQTAPGKPPQTLVEYFAGASASTPAGKAMAMDELAGRIRPKISQNGNWITVRVVAETPQLAAQLAEAVLAQVDAFNSEVRKAQSLTDRQFAEERLLEIGAEVRAAENRLQAFRESNRDISFSPALTIQQERLENDVATRRALYSTVLQTYDREKMNAVRETRLLMVIGRPTVPFAPDPKSPGRAAILGIFGGMVLASAIALWREYLARIRAEGSAEYGEFSALRERVFGWFSRLFRRQASAKG